MRVKVVIVSLPSRTSGMLRAAASAPSWERTCGEEGGMDGWMDGSGYDASHYRYLHNIGPQSIYERVRMLIVAVFTRN